MKITIRFYGPLDKYGSQLGLYQQEIKSDFTLAQLVEQLGVPYSSLGLVVVNSVKRDVGYRLEENDEVKFFPIIAGG
ncbi:MAG TPA: hypothetical protein DEF42_02645 [Desulfosporosinus sp.]|nr:hypothetical protein [Desulfosporosinus sp.]